MASSSFSLHGPALTVIEAFALHSFIMTISMTAHVAYGTILAFAAFYLGLVAHLLVEYEQDRNLSRIVAI